MHETCDILQQFFGHFVAMAIFLQLQNYTTLFIRCIYYATLLDCGDEPIYELGSNTQNGLMDVEQE